MSGADTTAVRNLLRAVELEIAAEQRADGGNSAKTSMTVGELIGPVDSAGSDGAERREYRYRCGRWPAELDAAAELVVRPAGNTGPWTAAEVTLAPDGRRRVVTTLAFAAAPPNLQVRADDTAAWTALAARLRAVSESPAQEPESARQCW